MKGFPTVDITFKNSRPSKILAHCFWQIHRILLLTSHAKAHGPTLSQALASSIKLKTSWTWNNRGRHTAHGKQIVPSVNRRTTEVCQTTIKNSFGVVAEYIQLCLRNFLFLEIFPKLQVRIFILYTCNLKSHQILILQEL